VEFRGALGWINPTGFNASGRFYCAPEPVALAHQRPLAGRFFSVPTYGVSQHLNYHADRDSTIYCGIEVLGFYCPYPRYYYSLVSSGGEFQIFPPTAGAPAAPPPAGLY